MADVIEIPLDRDHRNHLKSYASGYLDELIRGTLFGTFMVSALVFTALSYAADWLITDRLTASSLMAIAAFSIAVGVYITRGMIIETYDYWKDRKEEIGFAKDLKAGIAHRLTSEVSRVVEIDEYEDEGLGFFLELDDGRVLAVVSQDLYEFAHGFEYDEDEEDNRDAFPHDRIEFTYAPASGLHLEIKGVGSPLVPAGRVATGKQHFRRKAGKRGIREFLGAQDGQFYEGSLEDVLGRLNYTLEPI